MARSTYIYLLVAASDGAPYAAFTVKHELVAFIKKRFPKHGHLTVLRFIDGGHGRTDTPEWTVVGSAAEVVAGTK